MDPRRLVRAQQASGKALKDFDRLQMSSGFPWCIASIPIPSWARTVFPDASEDEAMERLWDAIFQAVRISGDSMVPFIGDGSVVYVNRDPLRAGDVGIFCDDGDMFCKQYYKDPAGIVYLFSLNRRRADADVILTPSGSRSLVCFGRVIMHALPLPGKG